ncbi:MAG: Gfo/Idh/MocA family oxidoreductase [Armatimonadaceae bacterium]
MSENLNPLRWGILGAGGIAKRVSNDVATLSDHKLYAVGSRDKAKADAFADNYDIPNRYGSYEELCADPEIDLIYVATPHTFHKEHTLLALEHGKAVLCEKPFTINEGEAKALVDKAREKNLFLMEGMWSRCFPAMAKVRELIHDGAIGEPRLVEADFGFRSGVNPEGRLFNLALGGGGLMDVGVYPVSLAQMILGEPNRIASLANLGSTGVDEEAAMLLGFAGGELAVLYTAVRLNTPQSAVILGTEGRIEIPKSWWCPKAVVLHKGNESERFDFPFEGGGFQFEAMHVADCLRQGLKESPLMTLDMSLGVMRTLDGLRAQFGLKYPME